MKRIVWLAACLALAGCVDVKEKSLSANVVRVETNAQGYFFTSSAANLTMRRAAEVTLQRGYTHFILSDESLTHGQVAVESRVNQADGTSRATQVPSANVSATVIMFRASDPGAKEAYDAKAILKQLDAKT